MRPTSFDHPGAAHLTDEECLRIGRDLKMSGERIAGPPTGVVVGEMPGETTIATMPLFPYPGNASGARLLRFSGMPPEIFLGRLVRVNIFAEKQEWKVFDAMERARDIIILAGVQNTKRIVVLGARAARAFGLMWEDGSVRFCDVMEVGAISICAIPHPSGLSRAYNDAQWIKAAKIATTWAATYGDYSTENTEKIRADMEAQVKS